MITLELKDNGDGTSTWTNKETGNGVRLINWCDTEEGKAYIKEAANDLMKKINKDIIEKLTKEANQRI